MLKKSSQLLILSCLLQQAAFSQSNTDWRWETEKSGPYAAGYKTVIIKNSGRPFSLNPAKPRQLPLHIWYPAKIVSNKTRLKFIDYVINDKNVTWPVNSASAELSRWVKQYVDSSVAQSVTAILLNMTTGAVKNPAPAGGKFPVVLIGNGLNTPGFSHTILAEYLASHGYVVLAIPSIPENDRAGFTLNERGLLNQVSDIEMIMQELVDHQYADINKLSLVSWSVGGAAQMIYQMKNRNAKAIVSLDGAMQYQYGWELVKNSAYFDSIVTAGYLEIEASAPMRFVVQRSDAFYDSVATDKKHLEIKELAHLQMLSIIQIVRKISDPAGYTTIQYEKVCNEVKLFLDSRFK